MQTGFQNRLNSALKWEDEVKDKLESIGFLANRYGVGVQLSPEFHNAIRFMNNNPTAQFVRYLPDWIIAIKDKMCYLVEAKSELRADTPNYSYELASYEIGMKLYSIGVEVIIVFTGWRADFIHNLTIHRRFDNHALLRTVQGSRTPFGLIKKDSVPTFDEFFYSINFSQR